MKITQHTGIFRFGQHERPVTIEDDDGRIYDTVLLFDVAPDKKRIDDDAKAYLDKMKIVVPPVEPSMISIDEVESVLKSKKLMTANEKWGDWKNKPAESAVK